MSTSFCEAVKSGKWAEASKALTSSIEKAKQDQQDGGLETLYINRAFVYRQLGMLRKALTDLDTALKTSPNNATALVRKAEVLKALGKAQDCQAVLQKAFDNFSPYTDAALILHAQGVTDNTANTQMNGAARLGLSQATPSKSVPTRPDRASSSAASSSKSTSSHMPAATSSSSAIPEALVPDQVLVQQAVEMINQGKTAEAEVVLTRVISRNSRDFAARLSRGTARALRRELEGAIDDFSVAIEVLPFYGDAWKRRGQARSALGQHTEAMADMDEAIKLASDDKTKAECYFEKGMVYNKLRNFRKAVTEFEQSVGFDKSNIQAWNLLGLCRTSMGDIQQGVDAYTTATQLQPTFREAWLNMAHALKEAARVSEAEVAFNRALQLDSPKKPSFQLIKLMSQMKQGCGDHRGAIDLLTRALKYAEGDHKVEALYWRAVCHHALGVHKQAVEDYEACYQVDAAQLSDEAKTQQVLAFYQKEMALYIRKNIDKDVATFCMDAELNPVFKELWCKKAAPSQELLAIFPQIAQPQLPRSPAPPPPPVDAAPLSALLSSADLLGQLLQYTHQGFLPNKRQHRMGGLAAIELAQTIRQLVSCRQAGRDSWVRSEGASNKGGCSGRHIFGWRDAMDIVVKWRQLSEPNDQVVWVDLLTRTEFESGFGSHTPMFSGQTKCVRYYMNCDRAMKLFKKVLLEEHKAYDAANNAVPLSGSDAASRVVAAASAQDLWLCVGKDCWVVVPIQSISREGHSMEGTRLTLVRVPNQPDAYEFSIRTPVIPARWEDFDKELDSCFDAVIDALCRHDCPLAANRILHYCYYWYNFMPLARGTAVVGYITCIALFMAAGMNITANIPKDYQVDWEGILAQHPQQFVDSVSSWLYPPAARGNANNSNKQEGSRVPDIDTLPTVSETLNSMRYRLEALNGKEAPRI